MDFEVHVHCIINSNVSAVESNERACMYFYLVTNILRIDALAGTKGANWTLKT